MTQYRECDIAVRVHEGTAATEIMDLADAVGGRVTQASRGTPEDYVITVAEGREDKTAENLRTYPCVADASRIALVNPTGG